MDILVDTQIFLWSFDTKSPLTERQRGLLTDHSNKIVVSQISQMEIAIKKAVGKLPATIPELPELKAQWLANSYEILSLTDEQIANYQNVPFLEEHRDPFDRFLIGIAHYERMAVLTEDRKFPLYNGFVQLL